jgi:signal transduction histidine kinase
VPGRFVDSLESTVRQGAIPPTPLKRNDGRIFQYQCFVLPDDWRMLTYFDITELRTAQEKLARVQKMEAIGLMAGGVAHDLNNILSGIMGYPELMLMQLPESSSLRKPLEAIRESGSRAAAIVADLLTVARGAASSREPHSLHTLVREYLNSPEYWKLELLYPQVHCVTRLEADHCCICCSSVHIKKAVMNLITNAMEAVNGNGTVELSTVNRILETEEDGLAPGEYVVLMVRDNGPGISDKDLQHIFEPFYSRKVVGRSGTGLGLTVVWNTVQDHDGRIRVDSSGQGTCFSLYFPVCMENGKSDRLPEEEQAPAGEGEHILIVDDESQIRDLASQMLSSLGYRVSSVASGEEAVEFVRRQAVDLLVIDMIMDPGMNGRRTYEEILRLRPGQRAIIVSGYSESDDIKAALKTGATEFVKKPYTLQDLSHAVRAALSS